MKNILMDPVFLEHNLFCSGAVTAMWRFFWLFPLFLSAFFNQLQQNPGDLLLCDLLRSAVCVSLDSEKKAAAGACSVGAEMMTCDVMHMWCCDADDKMRKDTPRKREKDYSHRIKGVRKYLKSISSRRPECYSSSCLWQSPEVSYFQSLGLT